VESEEADAAKAAAGGLDAPPDAGAAAEPAGAPAAGGEEVAAAAADGGGGPVAGITTKGGNDCFLLPELCPQYDEFTPYPGKTKPFPAPPSLVEPDPVIAGMPTPEEVWTRNLKPYLPFTLRLGLEV